jgi:hypothetical protein
MKKARTRGEIQWLKESDVHIDALVLHHEFPKRSSRDARHVARIASAMTLKNLSNEASDAELCKYLSPMGLSLTVP